MLYELSEIVEVSPSSSGRQSGYSRRAKHNYRTVWVQSTALNHSSDACLLWPFTKMAKGYGRYRCKELGTNSAHRVVCILAHGKPPTLKHQVAHSCGNPACVSPKHLRWATCRENLSDRAGHGTLVKGDKHHNTKHSDATVSKLHTLFYEATAEWAKELGMTPQTARRILRGASRK